MIRWTSALVILSVGIGCAVHATSAADEEPINHLTEQDKIAGWTLLFDGKSFDGWHNFKEHGVGPGWQIRDGLLVCDNPKEAGDIVTIGKYDWFELSIDYNISVAGNSGIMLHVTDDGAAMWATGPEIQLEDDRKAQDPERSGWMYQLYKPEIDPRTDRPVDATKPAGEWNRLRVVVAPPPTKSEVFMNGVKYYEFVWNSDDFKSRIAKSKFASMRGFAKADAGYIGLQGDHGSVSFRNIKLRRRF
jgi:Domain of Unknown Function (DUF1080)